MVNDRSPGRARIVSWVDSERTTLDTLNAWAAAGERFDVFACCDATTAHWLCLGGARVLYVVCRAAQTILGLSARESVPLGLMAMLGTAVSQEAQNAFVIVEYPNELSRDISEHVGQIRNLSQQSRAAAIKVEGSAASLRKLLASPELASLAIVAELTDGSVALHGDAETVLLDRGNACDGDLLTTELLSIADAGAAAILLESMDPVLADTVVCRLRERHSKLPILGCNMGHACPGRVHLLSDELGLGVDETSSGGLGVELAEIVRRYLDTRPKALP